MTKRSSHDLYWERLAEANRRGAELEAAAREAAGLLACDVCEYAGPLEDFRKSPHWYDCCPECECLAWWEES